MADPSITIRKAGTEDLVHVESLLKANNLPFQDVRTNPDCFFVVTDAEVIGAGGVEIYGSSGLLRSVVIKESRRGRGYGSALCDALEEYAQSNGVETLYSLTTTAPEFFRRYGYEETDRESAPARIRRTTAFTDFCPTSAICMEKDVISSVQ